MTLAELVSLLEFPAAPAELILSAAAQLPDNAAALADRIDAPEHWADALDDLSAALSPDPDGIRMLAALLSLAARRYPDWQRAGIDDAIFIDTMKCFPRFTGECFRADGRWCFDRAFWVPRQLTMRLFRVGMLEYELTEQDGRKVIGLHIPSDASLLLPGLRASWEAGRGFIGAHFPEYADAPILCESWLLAPCLTALLPEKSHIVAFQRQFRITEVLPEADDYLEWVYCLPPEARKHPNLAALPENTSLRKAMKQHLLSGGKVGIAEGILADNPFLA